MEEISLRSSLAPGFLIAAPTMRDKNFAGAVVLLAEHDDGGSVGFIINKPTGLSLALFLESVDDDLADLAQGRDCADDSVFVGGPVQEQIAWVLYRGQPQQELEEGSMRVGEHLVLGASMDTLRDFVEGRREGPFRVLMGYAGWGVGQLANEIGEGAWLPLELLEELALETPTENCWERAIEHFGLVPGGFMMGGPGAKA